MTAGGDMGRVSDVDALSSFIDTRITRTLIGYVCALWMQGLVLGMAFLDLQRICDAAISILSHQWKQQHDVQRSH